MVLAGDAKALAATIWNAPKILHQNGEDCVRKLRISTQGVAVPNGPERAEFWRSFIVDRFDYPAPDRLNAQLAVAEFHSFCCCGCNSFDVRIPLGSNVLPLTKPAKRGGMFFEADFDLASRDHLEVLLFVDESGNLSFVEIDVNGNSTPVPDEINIVGPAHHGHVSATLLQD